MEAKRRRERNEERGKRTNWLMKEGNEKIVINDCGVFEKNSDDIVKANFHCSKVHWMSNIFMIVRDAEGDRIYRMRKWPSIFVLL